MFLFEVRVPDEVLEHILQLGMDEASDDGRQVYHPERVRDLAGFCLVSSRWNAVGRPILYHHIYLRHRLMVERRLGPRNRLMRRAMHLARTLSETEPGRLPRIQHLTFQDYSHKAVNARFTELMNLLPHLQSLTVYCDDWGCVFAPMDQIPPNLSILNLIIACPHQTLAIPRRHPFRELNISANRTAWRPRQDRWPPEVEDGSAGIQAHTVTFTYFHKTVHLLGTPDKRTLASSSHGPEIDCGPTVSLLKLWQVMYRETTGRILQVELPPIIGPDGSSAE